MSDMIDSAAFEALKREVMRRRSPPPHVMGVIDDVYMSVGASELLHEGTLDTEDPENMIVARCRACPGVSTDQVVVELERTWSCDIACGEGACTVSISQDVVSMLWIMLVRSRCTYITGKIEVAIGVDRADS